MQTLRKGRAHYNKQFSYRKPGSQSTHSVKSTGWFTSIGVRILINQEHILFISELICCVQNIRKRLKMRSNLVGALYRMTTIFRKADQLIYHKRIPDKSLIH